MLFDLFASRLALASESYSCLTLQHIKHWTTSWSFLDQICRSAYSTSCWCPACFLNKQKQPEDKDRNNSITSRKIKFYIMGPSNSRNLDIDFFNRYATDTYNVSRGAFGNVYGPIPLGERKLAIKEIMFADGQSTEEIKRDIEAKQEIWGSLEHVHLIRVHSINLSQLPKALYIVLEYAAGGPLSKTLRELGYKNKLPIDVVTDWTAQIAEGMLHLHKKNIMHRDLKSSNVLLLEPFDFRNSRKTMTLKITNFDEVKKHDHTTTMSFVGTCNYMAPEIILDLKASDVWSFGVLIWEMLSGQIPHKGKQPLEIINKSQRGELDGLPIATSFPKDYNVILEKCWKSARKERLSFDEILDVLRRIEIWRLTSLNDEVFIVRFHRQDLSVYDSMKFRFKRRMTVDGMMYPRNIVSCSVNNCIYISDWSYQKLGPAILRIDPIKGNLIRVWNMNGGCGRISVARDSNVILCLELEANLFEYTADGEFIRMICLSPDLRGPATYAVKLDSGLFAVCQPDPSGVYLLATKKSAGKLGRNYEVEILCYFNENSRKLQWPDYLSVDREGSILVSDALADEVVLLSPNLDNARILVSKEDGMRSPRIACFDESTGKWIVTDGLRIFVCWAQDDKVERQVYHIIS